ncbi:CREB/ATF bZIP transcription factor [Xenopus laevis]|uniref:BZIP domain-containing protein n=2 Tax=Xenopus laevis TaxID=8355 RepID=A0A974DMC5_XENLA|nr:CREB/ATF bZIP transcription factor [Xenopus laevis]OCT93312.1 hypothetical protein XELAEV_18016379mg [Xenopus laevis]
MRHRLRDRANRTLAPAQELRPARRAQVRARKVTGAEGRHRGQQPMESQFHCHSDNAVSDEAAAGGECIELDIEGEGSAGWWEEHEAPHEEEPFAELLQQLVGSVDFAIPADGTALADTWPSKMAPDSTNMAAASGKRATGRCQDNRNALAARLNRLRKKEYVHGLENQVARLSEENKELKHERKSLCSRVRELEGEVRYLRAVLANDSALSLVLNRLTGLGGTRLSTSLFCDPYGSGGDHDYALPLTAAERDQEVNDGGGGGVCLHVDKDKLSVEFCAVCSRSASSADKIFFFRWFLAFLCCRS